MATNLTISNDFDEASTPSGHQAVALNLSADRASTPATKTYGFLFYRSRIRGAAAAGTTNPGRPWRPDAQTADHTPQRYLAGSDGWNPIS